MPGRPLIDSRNGVGELIKGSAYNLIDSYFVINMFKTTFSLRPDFQYKTCQSGHKFTHLNKRRWGLGCQMSVLQTFARMSYHSWQRNKWQDNHRVTIPMEKPSRNNLKVKIKTLNPQR